MSEQQQDKGKGAFRKAWDAQKKQAKKHSTKPSSKTKLHPRNPHNGPYNLDELVKSVPELEEYITLNVKGEKTVKFAEPQAVLLCKSCFVSGTIGRDCRHRQIRMKATHHEMIVFA